MKAFGIFKEYRFMGIIHNLNVVEYLNPFLRLEIESFLIDFNL